MNPMVRHVAGPYVQGVQLCSRCGFTLVDHRGEHVDPPTGAGVFAEGESIVRDGARLYVGTDGNACEKERES